MKPKINQWKNNVDFVIILPAKVENTTWKFIDKTIEKLINRSLSKIIVSGHSLAQSQQWKHQNTKSILFKVKYEDSKTTTMAPVVILNLGQILHVVLVFTLLKWN